MPTARKGSPAGFTKSTWTRSTRFQHDPQWAKAKELCRLDMEDIRMAKELGTSPRSLMKNRPSKSQQWKLPVKFWIRGLYEKMLERRANRQARTPAERTVEATRDVSTGGTPTTPSNGPCEWVAPLEAESDRVYDEIPF
jgi:hypothetical protein